MEKEIMYIEVIRIEEDIEYIYIYTSWFTSDKVDFIWETKEISFTKN